MTPFPVPTVGTLSGADVEAIHDEIVGLYALCYAGPPWHETATDFAAYAERLRTWADIESFTALVASDRRTGRLVGAAYGWRGPAEIGGVPLTGVDAALPLHVADLMVHPDGRRRGLGHDLLPGTSTAGHPPHRPRHPDQPPPLAEPEPTPDRGKECGATRGPARSRPGSRMVGPWPPPASTASYGISAARGRHRR